MKKTLLLMLSIIVLFSGCKDDDPGTLNVTTQSSTGDIQITNGNALVGSNGGTVTLSVTSNVDWSVSGMTGWCSVSQQSGSGDQTVTVTIAKNTSLDSRFTSLVITAKGVDEPFSIKISQEGDAPKVTADPTSLSYALAGNQQTITVTSNVAWTASLETAATWCHLSTSSGNSGTGQIVVTVDKSEQIEPRTNAILIKGTGVATPVKVVISQLGEGPTIMIDANTGSVNYEQHNDVTVKTTSNIPYTISYAPSTATEWLSEVTTPSPVRSSLVEKTHTFKVNANGTREIRTAQITFSNTTEGKSATYTLTQGIQPAAFSIDPTSLSYTVTETSKTITVNSNVAWTATVKSEDASWCTVSPSSAAANDANKTITVTLSGTNTAGRNTTITFTGPEITTPVVVALEQEAPVPPSRRGDSIALAAIYKQSITKKAWDASIKWDLENEPINNWPGVKLNAEGRVISLTLGTGTSAIKWVYLDDEMNFEPLNMLENLTIYPLTTGIVGNVSNPRYESKLPSSIFKLTNLKNLIIDGEINPTQTPSAAFIPPTIGDLTKLQRLIIKSSSSNGHNFNGAELPSSIVNLTALKNLTLIKTKFSGAFPAVGNLSSLDTLWIEGNTFTNFPANIDGLTNLTYLTIASNNADLGSLPTSIGSCTKLKYLAIVRFTGTIPTEIGNLTELISLSLSGNTFTNLPNSLNNLTKLQYLYVSSNNISGILPNLGNLTVLKTFEMVGNTGEITGGIPASFGSMASLSRLSFQNSKLTGTLPRELGQLTELTYLDISKNNFSGAIPAELGNLKKITTRDFRENKFTSIEEGVIEMGATRFTDWTFDKNELVTLPKDLAKYATKLTLTNNKLTAASLPSDFTSTTLTTLSLGNNLMESIPDCIFGLTTLTSLDIASNKLTSFPSGVQSLIKLTTLNLYNNEMTGAIPDIFDFLPNLGTSYGLFNIAQNRFSGTNIISCTHSLRKKAIIYNTSKLSNYCPQKEAATCPFEFTVCP